VEMFILLVVVVLLLFVLKYNKAMEWLGDEIPEAYKLLDVVVEENRILGGNLELIHSRESIKSAERAFVHYYDQLLMTKKGAFVLLKIKLDSANRKRQIVSIDILKKKEAKDWLREELQKYINVFGSPPEA